jgi:hypothetical protein
MCAIFSHPWLLFHPLFLQLQASHRVTEAKKKEKEAKKAKKKEKKEKEKKKKEKKTKEESDSMFDFGV